MAWKRYSDDEVLRLWWEIELSLAEGLDVVSARLHASASDAIYHDWHQRFSGASKPQLAENNALEKANALQMRVASATGLTQDCA